MAGRNYVCLITADKKIEAVVAKVVGQSHEVKTLHDGSMGEPKFLSMRNIIERSRKVIVGFSENQRDLEKMAAYIAIVEMIEKNELDTNKFIPVMITPHTVIPKVFDVYIPGKGFERDFFHRLLKALAEEDEKMVTD